MSAAEEVVRRMAERGLRLAVVEATTGGLTGHRLVAVPGASRVFTGGVAPYGRQPKVAWLHVPEETFVAHGSVHEATALALARGARDALEVEIAVAETGIASPTDNPERPGGLYCLALVGPGGHEHAERQTYDGGRAETMQSASDRLLAMVLEYLDRTG